METLKDKTWYWIKPDGWNRYIPCFFNKSSGCFILGGIGDESSNGVYESDIETIGPEIQEFT